MQTIDALADDSHLQDQSRERFWSRQFSNHSTSSQTIFDVLLGVIAPILCFWFDPIVFNTRFRFFSPAPWDVHPYKVSVFLFSALSILTLSLWLILGNRSRTLSAIFAGVLLSGALCSLLIGIIILPLSIVGLMLLIGVFGFVPFLTSFVYLRNSIRALGVAKPLLKLPKLAALCLLGAILVIAPSVVAQRQVGRIVAQSMNDLLLGDSTAAESATQSLRYLGWAINTDKLASRYARETDQTRKAILAKAYKEITGDDIDDRTRILLD